MAAVTFVHFERCDDMRAAVALCSGNYMNKHIAMCQPLHSMLALEVFLEELHRLSCAGSARKALVNITCIRGCPVLQTWCLHV